jgi:hypothetical protein
MHVASVFGVQNKPARSRLEASSVLLVHGVFTEDGGDMLLRNVGLIFSTLHLVLSLNLVKLDRLCGLVVRFPGYRSRGPVSIPGANTFSEK